MIHELKQRDGVWEPKIEFISVDFLYIDFAHDNLDIKLVHYRSTQNDPWVKTARWRLGTEN